jgi:hypothetical protein
MMESNQPLPGGGQFGRGARREVRNPILALPSARAILALPAEQRAPFGVLLREMAFDSDRRAQDAWSARKGIMAAYWRGVATYSKHLARAIDPKPGALPLRSL